MIKLFRFLMIALLALAIPVQGVAAAAMLYCGPDHPAGGVAGHATGHAAGHDVGHVHVDAQDGHSQAGHDHAQPAVLAADLASVPDAPDQPVPAKCSVCAACCSAAAIAASTLLFSPPGMEPLPVLMSSSLSYSFITDGPLRPPRSFLA